MKIGIVSETDYRENPLGGTLVFLKNILKKLDNNKFVLFGFANKNEKIGKKYPITIGNKKFVFFPFYKKKGHIPGRLNSFFYLYKYLIRIKKMHLDFFYVHSPELVLPLIQLNKPIIFHMHGATHPLRYSKYNWARNKLIRDFFSHLILMPAITKSDLVIGINEECRKLANTINQKNFIYIPVCIDTDLFKPMNKIKCKKIIGMENKFIISYTGRFGKVKGLDLLLNIFKLVIKRYKNARLVLIGKGEEEEKLKKLAKSLKLFKFIKFIGQIPNERLPIWLNASDIYIMTSYREGTPLSLLEAMSCQLPVITTNVGGISEVIKNKKNGILIKKRDPKIFFDAIEYLKNKKNYYNLGKEARKTILINFSNGDIAKKINNLFKK